MITTTLKKIRDHSPCQDVYKKLCKNLGGVRKYGSNTPVKFSQIIQSNGLDDAIWCFRTICPEHDNEVRLFAADCAESVLYLFEEKYPNDKRPRQAITAARDFVEGKITQGELAAARAAWAAAWGAAGAAEQEKQIKMLIKRFG